MGGNILNLLYIVTIFHHVVVSLRSGEADVCASDQFQSWSDTDQQFLCKSCRTCPPEQEIKQACTQKADTVCACKPSSFVSTEDDSVQCAVCTNCTALHRHLTESCAAEKDAACGRCLSGYHESETEECVDNKLTEPMVTGKEEYYIDYMPGAAYLLIFMFFLISIGCMSVMSGAEAKGSGGDEGRAKEQPKPKPKLKKVQPTTRARVKTLLLGHPANGIPPSNPKEVEMLGDYTPTEADNNNSPESQPLLTSADVNATATTPV